MGDDLRSIEVGPEDKLTTMSMTTTTSLVGDAMGVSIVHLVVTSRSIGTDPRDHEREACNLGKCKVTT